MSDFFDTKVSFFQSVTSLIPKIVSLSDMLFSDKYREQVLNARLEKANKGDEAYKTLKMKLPLFTPSGLFSGSKANTLISHSGLMCIDIDGKDNPDLDDFDELKDLIAQVPYVTYCGRSVGGRGYFALIPIAEPDKHKEHFLSLEQDFARCGLVVDKACKDVSRKRFVSFDSRPYINENAKVYERLISPSARKSAFHQKAYKGMRGDNVDKLIETIQRTHTDITGSYDQWFRIGCALATEYGEAGRRIFHAISEQGVSYNYRECNRKYTDCLRAGNRIGIGTLFFIAKNYGI